MGKRTRPLPRTTVITEGYEHYCDKVDNPVSKKEWNAAVKALAFNMFEALWKGDTVFPPHRIGTFHFMRYKPKGKAVDFAATKKYGRTIYHDRANTFGQTVGFRWTKHGYATFKGTRLWKAQLVRGRVKGKENSLAERLKKFDISHLRKWQKFTDTYEI